MNLVRHAELAEAIDEVARRLGFAGTAGDAIETCKRTKSGGDLLPRDVPLKRLQQLTVLRRQNLRAADVSGRQDAQSAQGHRGTEARKRAGQRRQ